MSEEDSESEMTLEEMVRMRKTEMIHPNETRPPVLLEPAGGETEKQSFGVNNPNLDETADVGKPDVIRILLDIEEAQRFLKMVNPFGLPEYDFCTYDDHITPDGTMRHHHELTSYESADKFSLPTLFESLTDFQCKAAGIFVRLNAHRIRCLWVDDDNPRNEPRTDFPIEPMIIVESSPGRFQYYWPLHLSATLDHEVYHGIMRYLVKNEGHNKYAMEADYPMRLPGTYNCKNLPFMVRVVGGSGKMVSLEDILKAFPAIEEEQTQIFDKNTAEITLPKQDYAIVEMVQNALRSMPRGLLFARQVRNDVREGLFHILGDSAFQLWRDCFESFVDGDDLEKQWRHCKTIIEPKESKLAIANLFQYSFDHDMEQSASEPNRFYDDIVLCSEIEGKQDSLFLIDEFLPAKELIVLAGQWGTGKTFLLIDILMAVARGVPWRGLSSEQEDVMYIGLEGHSGFPNRLTAYLRQHCPDESDIPFAYLPTHLNLRSESETRELIDAIRKTSIERGLNFGIIAIDTLSRALAGGDDSAGGIMGSAITNALLIQRELGTAVILVHHFGKDVRKGLRGYSNLAGDVATIVGLEKKSTDTITATTAKQKEGEEGLVYPYRLERVTLGEDKNGKPVTSCIVEHLDQVVEHKPAPKLKGKNFETMQLLCEVLPEKSVARPAGSSTIPDGERVITDDDYCDAYLQSGISGAAKEADQKRAYRRARDYLVDKGFIGIDGDHIWIIDPHHKSLASPES